jgi:hypothetical protein
MRRLAWLSLSPLRPCRLQRWCPPVPAPPVATGWARPDIIGIDSVSVPPFSIHISASAGVAIAGTDSVMFAEG